MGQDILDSMQKNQANQIISEMDSIASACVDRSVLGNRVAIGFSHGIDSSILAKLACRSGFKSEVLLLTLGMEDSHDIVNSATNGHVYGFQVHSAIVSEEELRQALSLVLRSLPGLALSHVEDCTAFLLVARELSRLGGFDALISANGPDELFCGYDRFRRIANEGGYAAVESEITSALETAYKLQANVCDLLDSESNIQFRSPFLEKQFVDFGIEKVPTALKITCEDDRLRKRVWREFGRYLGLPEEIVCRPKKAMQYSMGFHKVILKLLSPDANTFLSPDVARS